ncbi:MAG: Dam family site-specific DNA-(adenine-N6)-methyltransferase [Candidatus Moeniiplasma glomeromycotorum]|nr:Dam family site-specific DNA-(adenine-N6)-methyltransferase [Candidatus Moeniiplasma glomeromycotorum]MCE8167075.1 Dam family site-specific DNA-(adenine-N6)-methyltransferase [Candidatus Moeniiplasma glomeromycotorum]MCE8168913.1 Dam family site-specific DNA-(adenine-N6)-methyltransferase [Candidatus Moeniiplasma glomeromycotorum]
MNEQLLMYFRQKKAGRAATCFKCKEVNENIQYFTDLFRCYIQKEKSSICTNCLDKGTEYYKKREAKGENIIEKIQKVLEKKFNKKIPNNSVSDKELKKTESASEVKKKKFIKPKKNRLRGKEKGLKYENKVPEQKNAVEADKSIEVQESRENNKIFETKRSTKKKLQEAQREVERLHEWIEKLNEELKQAKLRIVEAQKKEKRNDLKEIKEPLMMSKTDNLLEANEIYNLDCLDLFKKMKENKIVVDAIITDPPYNISKSNNFTSIGRAGIDFGHWDYGFDQSTWIKESYSLLKKGGSIIIFNDWRNFGEISKTLEEVGYEVKDLLRWVKKNPMPRNTGRRYVTDYELAIWAVKNGKKWIFNFKKDENKPYLIPQYEGSVEIGKKRIHPTQKSLQVFKNIIELHTNVGDLVLDPFIGSGTTAVACKELGRNYIGSEIDTNYFNKSKLRIENYKTGSPLIEEFIKSPINYTGNKYKLLKQILPFFPKRINKFIDAFGGSGTMIVNVPAKKYFYNDNNNHVVSLIEYFKKNSYEFIIEKVEKLVEKFFLSNTYKNGYEKYKIVGNEGLSKYNKDDYRKLRDYYNETSDISALFCLVIFGFNHQIRFNEKKLFNIPVGKTDFNEKVRKNLKKFCEKLKNIDVEVKNKDFSEFLKETEVNSDDFVYCDPPYFIADATYNVGWGIKEEKKLLEVLSSLDGKGVKFALSNVVESNGRKNNILINWAKKYKVNYLDFSYKNSNYQRKNKGRTIEVLVTNY